MLTDFFRRVARSYSRQLSKLGARYEKVSAQQITSESLQDFASFMQEQNVFWAKIIKDVGIKTQ